MRPAGRAAAGLVAALATAGGCASLPLDRSADRGSTEARVAVSEVPRHGFTVSVQTRGDARRGELIAVGDDEVYLWSARTGALLRVSAAEIVSVHVQHGPRARRAEIAQLYQFARFPQGLPPGFGNVRRTDAPADRLVPPDVEPHDPYGLDDEPHPPGPEPMPFAF